MVIAAILESLGFREKVYPSLEELGIDSEKNAELCHEQRELFARHADTIRTMMERTDARLIDLKEIPEIGDLWKRAAQLPEAEWDLAWEGSAWLSDTFGSYRGSIQYAGGMMRF